MATYWTELYRGVVRVPLIEMPDGFTPKGVGVVSYQVCDPNNPPVAGVPTEPNKTTGLTISEFYDLFTLQEQEDWVWYLDRKEFPAGLAPTVPEERKLVLAASRLKVLKEVNLNHPLVVQSVQMLEQTGFIGAGRASQILSGQPL